MSDLVYLKDGKSITTSLQVAETFHKLHKHILESIKNLGCSQKFNETNFRPVEYVDQKGEKRPMYEITRDGFTILVMGFTGKKAMEFKEKYIEAFNTMEETLRELTEHTINNYAIEQAMNKIEQYTKKVTSELAQMTLFPMDININVKLRFKDEDKKIAIKIPAEKHKKYKEYCASHNLSMKGAIFHFIDECVKHA